MIYTFLGCGNSNNNSPVTPTPAETPKTEVTEAPTTKPPEVTLEIIKAKSVKQRIVDWGQKPEEFNEGGDTWVWSDWWCEGPTEGLRATSTLAPQGKFNYNVKNLGDDDPTTAWVEGHADYGIGEYIEFSSMGMGSTDTEVTILNGYQASQSSWENNSRVKHLKISMGTKDYFILELADVMGAQTFTMPKEIIKALETGKSGSSKVRLTIMDVYPGLKWKDTAISEIFRCNSNPG
ncbi:MAG: NADase-type glycan-binding domain-containing protein [Flavobacteriales bacterium]